MQRPSVPADVLDHVRRSNLTQADGPRTLRRVAATASLYVAALVLAEAVGHAAVWIAAWLICALVLLGWVAAAHEAVHNNLFISKPANRIAGIVLAGAAGVPWTAYRPYHLAHHSDTSGPTDPEPQEEVTNPAKWLLTMLLGGWVYLVQMWAGVFSAALGRPPVWATHRVHQRALRRTAVGGVVAAGLLVGVVQVGAGEMVRWWAAPLLLVWCCFGAFVTVPEHHGLDATGDALTSSRTMHSNAALRWLYWNANLHTAHHLLPSVPWQHLGELDEIIGHRAEHRASGYLAYHRDLLLRR